MSWNCPLKVQWDQFLADKDHRAKQQDDHVSNVEIELLDNEEDPVDVTGMTRAQCQVAGLPSIPGESNAPEPWKAITKEDWKEEEWIRNLMFDTWKEIELKEEEEKRLADLARGALQSQTSEVIPE